MAFSLFCLWLGNTIIWISFSTVLGLVFTALLIHKPERLWTEKHSLNMKKLSLDLLGDKNNPNVESHDYDRLYQPVESKRQNKIKNKK